MPVVADPGIFAVTARTEGGYIEGFEASQAWPAFGVQWHPERMHEAAEMNAGCARARVV
jgi:gamma-glutamyl-gamma-aminobutyrate hydrolase PuuD